MALRQVSVVQWEGMRALLSLAGIRIIVQSRVTGGGAGSNNTYTITDPRTRRVVMYVDHATNVIRVNVDAAATSTHLPVKNQAYFVVDAKKGQTIQFFDTTGATNVNFVEIE